MNTHLGRRRSGNIGEYRAVTIVAALLSLTLAAPEWTSGTQVPAPAEREVFDAVSIREGPTSSAARPIKRLGPASFSFTKATALDLIQEAFQIPEKHVVGDLPNWARSTRFDVVARSTGAPLTQARLRAMVKSLLKDRFQLNASFDQVTMPAYALSMARSDGARGPNLRSSEVECESDPLVSAPAEQPVKRTVITACGVVHITNGGALTAVIGGRVTMDQLAAHLSKHGGFDRPVVNRTGIKGEFDLFVHATADMPGPSEARFLIALREQAGMTLRAEKLPVDVLRIHRLERPSDN